MSAQAMQVREFLSKGMRMQAEMRDVAEAPCSAFFFDVETMDPAPEVAAKMEARWLAEWEPPENLRDPEKIEARRAEQLAKWRDRLALSDEAPVAMIGLMFEDETMILHGLKREAPKWLGARGKADHVSMEGFAGEAELMEATIQVLDARIRPETMAVGHNIFRFDLPKLRLAAVRHNLRLPEMLRVRLFAEQERQRLLDTMQHYVRYFGREGQMYVSAEAMQEKLGLHPPLKDVATGKDVPGLLAAGKTRPVAAKLFADLIGVRDAFLRMTGR